MKSVIYLRTSSEEQNPENQLKDCLTLVKGDYELVEEKKSAFKDEKRTEFDKIIEGIKSKKFNALICWDLDRLYRNRAKLLELFQLCKTYNCSIYSYRQTFLNEIQSIQLPSNFQFIKDMMFDNFLHFLGWVAEEESKKKSERIRIAIRKDGDQTKSYKGNLWGHHSLGEKVENQIIELHKQGKKLREIKESVYYWDKNNNKKNVSLGFVHKLLSEYKSKNNSNKEVQEITNL